MEGCRYAGTTWGYERFWPVWQGGIGEKTSKNRLRRCSIGGLGEFQRVIGEKSRSHEPCYEGSNASTNLYWVGMMLVLSFGSFPIFVYVLEYF